jgi:anaerobic magnesium-protoporphyrin IX monomethyl ester cyclase
MKISLVQAPRWSAVTPPYAVALLAGNLRGRGFSVAQKGLDPELCDALGDEEKRHWYGDASSAWNDDGAVAALIEKHSATVDGMAEDILRDVPDVVGFSVKTWSRVFSLALAERIKRRRPEVFVLFGGPEAGRLDAGSFLREHSQVDALCRQEADLSLPRFLEKMRGNGLRPVAEPGFAFRGPDGNVIDGGLIEEVPLPAQIPFADYSDYDFRRYQNPRALTMVLSRGCINRCSYCSEAPSFLRFRAYGAEQVFAEIEHHWQRSGCQKPMKIYFNDSLLDGSVEELEKLADLLLAHRSRMAVEYGGMMFVRDQLRDELIDKLARSGMTEVLFGLESGSEEVLRRMRKKFSLATAERVFRRFHEAGVFVTVSVIFGHPGESEAEFYRSLSFLRRNAVNVDSFLLNYLGLYGDCDITRHPEKYGVDAGKMSPVEWVADEGRNTFEVRKYRQHVARMLLGPKVCDIGGFALDGSEFYDPFRAAQAAPWPNRMAGGLLSGCISLLDTLGVRAPATRLALRVLPRSVRRVIRNVRRTHVAHT